MQSSHEPMNESTILCWSAAGIGTIHTLMGPDHYLPFVAMSRTGGWSARKTLLITSLCGMGHVLGSIVLGLIGVGLGTAVLTLEQIESVRGEIAAWMLIGFGLMYFAWAVIRANRQRSHLHWHAHDGTVHCHEHRHDAQHLHVHCVKADNQERASLTPWVLFTIFLFGPCEPLIPLLMYPAAAGSYWLLATVMLIFAFCTILTMTVVVWVACSVRITGRLGILARYAQPVAGLVILGCGIAIKAGF